jgi:ParB-like chromosome segregation protein Spo0J
MANINNARTEIQRLANGTVAFHPLAKNFPLLNGSEFNELVADVGTNGLHEPIVLYQGAILDGRNRYRACLKAKVDPRFEEFEGDDAAALAFVISKNIHRRHLKAKEKREAIAALLKASPEKSDRQIAGMIKASPTFVGKVRAEKEATGDVSTVDTRIDTKGREQPAKKPREDDLERRVAADAAKRAERKRKDLERRVAARAAKRKREAEAFCNQHDSEEAQTKTEAERPAAGLIGADRGLARALHEFLVQCGADAIDLMDALGHLLGSEGNGADAEASADKRREQFAALERDLSPLQEKATGRRPRKPQLIEGTATRIN